MIRATEKIIFQKCLYKPKHVQGAGLIIWKLHVYGIYHMSQTLISDRTPKFSRSAMYSECFCFESSISKKIVFFIAITVLSYIITSYYIKCSYWCTRLWMCYVIKRQNVKIIWLDELQKVLFILYNVLMLRYMLWSLGQLLILRGNELKIAIFVLLISVFTLSLA